MKSTSGVLVHSFYQGNGGRHSRPECQRSLGTILFDKTLTIINFYNSATPLSPLSHAFSICLPHALSLVLSRTFTIRSTCRVCFSGWGGGSGHPHYRDSKRIRRWDGQLKWATRTGPAWTRWTTWALIVGKNHRGTKRAGGQWIQARYPRLWSFMVCLVIDLPQVCYRMRWGHLLMWGFMG